MARSITTSSSANATGFSPSVTAASLRRRGTTPESRTQDVLEVTPSMPREPVNGSSRLWWSYKHAVLPAVIEFAGPVTRADVENIVYNHLLTIPRFSQRAVQTSASELAWEHDVNFDPQRHIRTLSMSEPSNHKALRDTLARLYDEPMDRTRPLWDMTLLEREGQGTILVARFHHAMSDGRGLVEALLRCADGTLADLAPALPKLPKPAPGPTSLWKTVRQKMETAVGFTTTALDIATRRPDTITSIKRAEDIERSSVSWLRDPWPIDEVKAIGKKLGGGTVNDVLLTALARALRAHLITQGDNVEGLTLHGLMPINLLPPFSSTGEVTLGNHIGAARCAMPVGESDPHDTFAAVKACMLGIKRGYEPTIAAYLMSLIGNSPSWLQEPLRRQHANQVSVAVSNVYGPPKKLSLAGHKVENMRWLGVQADNIGVFVPAISYDGHLNVGVSTDAAVVPDAEALSEHLAEQYKLLRELP